MNIPESHHLLLSNQLIISLMEETTQIQNFKGKWSAIKTKLNDLPTQLKDLSDFPNFSANPLSYDLLQSISQTLTEALALAKNCTQSDIDSIIAKLDQHIRDIDLLIRSEVLQDGVVGTGSSMKTLASKRELVRVEARNLIIRLQIGNPESKTTTMDSLLGLLQEDDKNVLIVVAQGVVPVLVRLLNSSCSEIMVVSQWQWCL